MLGAAESHRRRGAPVKAEDLFTEGQALALEIAQPGLEGHATLGLARIARARGHIEQAVTWLQLTEERFTAQGAQAQVAHITIEHARLALMTGRLDEANRLVGEALRQAHEASETSGAHGPVALANAVWGSVALAYGRLDQARAHAHEASGLAEREADDQALIEAALLVAEVELLADNLQAAVNAFNHAQALAQAREATVADTLTSVGLGRILLRRELWEEAAVAFQEAAPRLRATEDVTAQALVELGLGEARSHLADLPAARAAFEEAATLARKGMNPLMEAEALGSQARVTLAEGDAAAAVIQYRQALDLVTRVGESIADMGDRAVFFDGYAALYAEVIYAGANAADEAGALADASVFAGLGTRAGRTVAAQRLREYVQAIPTTGRDLSAEEQKEARRLSALLNTARKTLSR
jgi:tetratricopeptide (TPR) repeat protein